MKKKVKYPKDMTTDEAIAHVFHPKALKHLKKHVEKIANKKKKKTDREEAE
jgi:hypothetical protein